MPIELGADTLAIDVRELRKTYRDGLFGRRRVEALKGVSFRVQRGEIFGLLGPNGAGKTTLIKMLLGIVRGAAGQASLFGWPAGDRRGRIRVGYLPEHHRIPRHHTGNSALAYYGSLSGLSSSEIRRRRPALLDVVGLARWGKTGVRNYSKGMLQRLGLAQAMLHDPELLILDEPTDGVDPVGRSEMRAVLNDLKQAGKTIFLNSHLLQEVELICDRAAILNQGLVLREGRIVELTGGAESDIQLQLQLLGCEERMRAALAPHAAAELRAAGSGQFQVALRTADQTVVDRCVDDLRRHGISIVSMSRRRQTLEEAFLSILDKAPLQAQATQGPVNAIVV